MPSTISIRALRLVLIASSSIHAQDYIISTIAGGAPPPTPIQGAQAAIGSTFGVVADSAGTIYFSTELNCVFKLDRSGVMTRVAGNSRVGYSGDGGPATEAQFAYPENLALDASGNLYIVDYGNLRIRKISATGIITTVAGNGIAGYSGDGGPATAAELGAPSSVAVDASGNLYIGDNNRIRKVSAAGIINTIAGIGSPGYSGDGGPATSAQLNGPGGLSVDGGGNVYFADGNRVRKVSAAGIITTVAGNGSFGHSGDGGLATSAQLGNPSNVAVDRSGNLYIAEAGTNVLRKVSIEGIITTVAGNASQGFSGDGGPATNAQLDSPFGLTLDAGSNIYFADNQNSRVRKVSGTGIITTVAGNGLYSYSGDGGPAIHAQLDRPAGVALDAQGNVYFADSNNNRVRKVSSSGTIATVAGNGSPGYSGDGGPATSAQLFQPLDLAVDFNGNLYIADTNNNRIRKVSTIGIITTVAGGGTGGLGDGGPATSAQLRPESVAVDVSGNLYIADTPNARIRKVSVAGIITTVAGIGPCPLDCSLLGDGGPATSAQLHYPVGVAVDSRGNLYIADTGSALIRKVSAAGIITTVAGGGPTGNLGDGGPATNAQLPFPTSVAADLSGNFYIADGTQSRIRKVSSAGIITTIAGVGSPAYTGDGGPATNAQLELASGMHVDSRGRIYFAGTGNNAIRLLTPSNAACGYSVPSTSFQSPAAGGSLIVALAAGAGCGWAVSSLPDWISVAGPATGSGSANITLVVATNTGAPRLAQVFVASVAVTVEQASSVLSVSTDGVVSNATFTAPLAPGSIAAVFGNFLLQAPLMPSSLPIPTSLGGLSLKFDGGTLAPLFYASSYQVDAQVPWELAHLAQTTITATEDGQMSALQRVSLATYAPGIFSTNGGGTGQGAILGPNNRLADLDNAAIAGSTVLQIFCTGLGPVTNQPVTGALSPTSPLAETTMQPTVMIGGAEAKVKFSGLAPGFVGLYQVNALVPRGVAGGSAVPVLISIGGVWSNTVTIAVQQ